MHTPASIRIPPQAENTTSTGVQINKAKKTSSTFSILMASAIIYYLWEAMIVSYLAARVVKLPFKSIRGLLDKSDYRIGLCPASFHEDQFRLSLEPTFLEAWNTRIKMHLDDYGCGRPLLDLVMADSKTGMYENFFSMR